MLALALAALGGGGAASARSAAAFDKTVEAFLTPRPAVLPDGRTITLHCAGQGSPTVILSAGAGDWAETWRRIVAPIARRTRVCGWDRAGYGFSGSSPEPQDVVHTELDLEAALRVAGVAGPYVLVGHSLGAYETLLFTDRHPEQVKAMVLIDPSFPDQDRIVRDHNPTAEAFLDRQTADQIAADRRCERALRTGVLRPGARDPDGCLAAPPDLPNALSAKLQALAADPGRARTRSSFDENFDRDTQLVMDLHRNYGAMHLTVLTAANDLPGPMPWPASVSDFLHTDWIVGHDALAALSKRGTNRIVSKTSHYIHQLQPAVVIEAINEAVTAARAAR